MGYEIFISAKTTTLDGKLSRDNELAASLFDFLQSQDYSVFLSTLTLEARGEDAYKEAIDFALDEATVMVVVGTSREHLDSKWVRYEWDSFFNDILSGFKPNGHLFTYVENLENSQLPRTLRLRQVFQHGGNSLNELGNFIRNALGSRATRGIADDQKAVEISESDINSRIAVRIVATKHDF